MSIKTGDIVLLDLEPTIAGEQSEIRPCLVLVGEGHPWEIVIVVPITDFKKRRLPKLFVPVPHPDLASGLVKQSAIDCFQIRCVALSRIKNKLGVVSQVTLDEVLGRVGNILNIGEEHVT